MMKLGIFTACIHDNTDPLARLSESCGRLNLPLEYFGIKARYGNLREAKIGLASAFVRTLAGKYEYLLFTDGFDSWMLKGEEEIINSFNSYNHKIVISAEKDCYPNADLIPLHPEVPSPFKFVNAGQYMGKTIDIINALSFLNSHYNNFDFGREDYQFNDNSPWMDAYVQKKLDIEVDYKTKLFLPMGSSSLNDIHFVDNMLYSRETGNSPCAIHFNGAKGESPNGLNMEGAYQLWKEKRQP